MANAVLYRLIAGVAFGNKKKMTCNMAYESILFELEKNLKQ